MLERLTDEELQFMENLHDPVALSECLFSDFDDLTKQDPDKLAHVRLAQLSMYSYEYLVDYENPELTKKENFRLREGSGTIYCFGGRKFGKTHFVEKIDICVSMLLLDGEHVGFTSLDFQHVKGVLEEVITVIQTNKFFEMFEPKINRSPNFRVQLKNGYVLESINMNIHSKEPGAQFFQKHFKRLYIEEASFETQEVYKKRIDAVSELGCVVRAAGMTNFTRYSPAGAAFNDPKLRKYLSNLPQYVNPMWDDKARTKALNEHGGEQSISYRMFVKGELVEDAMTVFDMDRVKQCYLENKIVKSFEVTKDSFHKFENILILERPKGVSQVYVCADIGESAPTEIIVIFQIGEKLRYAYNITLYNLTNQEQTKLFRWVSGYLQANIIGLDTTDGTGRAIYWDLEQTFGKDHMVSCAFNEKLVIDWERNDAGVIILKDGKPTEKEEYVSEWSVKRLKDLFYDKRVELPMDYKFDKQINSVVAVQTSNRTVYSCVCEEDHLFAAFRVFAIAHWNNEFRNLKPVNWKKFCKTGA